jgi:hypothetical protein
LRSVQTVFNSTVMVVIVMEPTTLQSALDTRRLNELIATAAATTATTGAVQ